MIQRALAPAVLALRPLGAQGAVVRDSVTWTDSATIRATVWAPLRRPAKLPLLVFSPGFGQQPAQYSTLLQSWVQRGYIVMAVAHPAFPNPDSVELYDAALVIARQLVDAVHHVLSQARDHGLLRDVAADRIGIVGHSVGGAAAAQACAWEARVRACMDLDGTLFGPVIHTGMRQPFFLIRQLFKTDPADPPRFLEHNDQANLHEDSTFAHTNTMYWLTVKGLDHMAFTDAALKPTAAERVKVLAGTQVSAQRIQEMTTAYVSAFFGAHLSGAPPAASLTRSPYVEAVLRRKP